MQVGLLLGEHAHAALPMDLVIANELEIVGSHGMQAHRYDAMLSMITSGKLRPEKLTGAEVTLAGSIPFLTGERKPTNAGATVLTSF